MMEIRMASALIWVALVFVLMPSTLRAVWFGGASVVDKVLAVVFYLAINRICFNLVNSFTPGEEVALAFCQVTGAMGGLVMCFVARSAIKAERRAR